MYEHLHKFLGFIKKHDVNIDSIPFKLHYQVTSLILTLCSVLSTITQFFGEPIHCFTSFKDDIPEKALNNFCWMQETFILPDSMHKAIGTEVAAPGVEKYTGKRQERIFQQYYQWVCFFLAFQSLCFYLPRFIWKILEHEKIKQLVPELRNLLDEDAEKEDVENAKPTKVRKISKYIVDNLGNHKLYTAEYMLCSLFNFVNVIGQIFITDAFLGGEFTKYGTEVFSFAQKDYPTRYDPMVKVFPRVTKCSFNKFGPSGDVQRHDAMCILSINVLNEKVFLLLWVWFLVLSVITGLEIAYQIAWLSVKPMQHNVLLNFNAKTEHSQLRRFMLKFEIGDWFFLRLLSQNMSTNKFRELVKEIDLTIQNGYQNSMQNGNGHFTIDTQPSAPPK